MTALMLRPGSGPKPPLSSNPAPRPVPPTPAELAALFDTPEDLRCPITHDALWHPVLAASGQVYERAAIERHLETSSTDPLTGAALASTALTPVYLLQSRAAEWRAATCRACLDAAAASPPQTGSAEPGWPAPARFLRRAAELASGGGLAPPGLPAELSAYVNAHPHPSHDGLIMLAFARGLQSAGLPDRAARVYFCLLCDALASGPDTPRAAALLAQCVACWGSATPSAGVKQEADGLAVDRLLSLVARQSVSPLLVAAPWTHILDLAGAAGLGDGFAVSLCERLLLGRPTPGKQLTARHALAVPSLGPGPPPVQAWDADKELLMRYTRLLVDRSAHQVVALESRVARLEAEALAARRSAATHAAPPRSATPGGPAPGLPGPGSLLRVAAAVLLAALAPQQEGWTARGGRAMALTLLLTPDLPRLAGRPPF